MIWQVSKTDENLYHANTVRGAELLQQLINENVPVVRHFYFTFLIEDMPIAFREQLVRTQYDHYWIQSGRITDWTKADVTMGKWDLQEMANCEEDLYRAYKDYIELAEGKGIPPEQYRHWVPLGAHHRGIWTANLESLITRFKKRTCWVAQSDYWLDVVTQAKAEIEASLGVQFTLAPPCKNGDWEHTGCTICATMDDRIKGTDPLPVCPIYAFENKPDMVEQSERLRQFEGIWGHAHSD